MLLLILLCKKSFVCLLYICLSEIGIMKCTLEMDMKQYVPHVNFRSPFHVMSISGVHFMLYQLQVYTNVMSILGVHFVMSSSGPVLMSCQFQVCISCQFPVSISCHFNFTCISSCPLQVIISCHMSMSGV